MVQWLIFVLCGFMGTNIAAVKFIVRCFLTSPWHRGF